MVKFDGSMQHMAPIYTNLAIAKCDWSLTVVAKLKHLPFYDWVMDEVSVEAFLLQVPPIVISSIEAVVR